MNHIMDNLIAAKRAKPMIVVMEKGYAERPVKRTFPFAGRAPAGRHQISATCSARSRMLLSTT